MKTPREAESLADAEANPPRIIRGAIFPGTRFEVRFGDWRHEPDKSAPTAGEAAGAQIATESHGEAGAIREGA